MMENRSFDHMLGHLSLSGRMPQVDGLQVPLEQALYTNPFDGRDYHPFMMRDARLDSDVPHNREHLPTQLAFSPATGHYRMNGFARGYFEYRPDDDTDQPPSLGILPAEDVPISTFFAEQFAVCDRWFSSLPTGTPPNKLISLSGRSRVEDVESRVMPADNLVTDWLTRRGIRWRTYHDGLPFYALLGRTDVIFDQALFRPFHRLATDVLNEPDDAFPQVILIEPAYEAGPLLGGRPRNDDHAPAPVGFGQALQRRLYQALTANPARWRRTLLIVTYDEHGGFYDHVAPLEIPYAPPDNEYAPFATTGPRVPGLVISPLVSAGSVYHGNLDHSSFLQLIAERFAPGEGGYSHEVNVRAARGIRSLSEVLDLQVPRDDIPAPPPFDEPPFDPGLMRLLPVEPVELLFDFGARKLVAESPPEARDALPELWDWLDAAGLDPHPVDSRGLELAGFGELMREEGGKPLAELPARVLRADLRTDFGYSGGAIPELSVSARIGAAAEVSAFNDVTDDDPDGLLAAEAEEGLEELLPPQLLLDDAHAWLKYTLSAELGTSGGATLDDLGVRIDAGKKLRLNDYRRHARDNIAVGTILSDLCRPRVALTTDHVLALRSGDCLAMQFVGTMAASVEITWADIFAGQFGNLGALLGGKQVIPLRLSTGLTVSASVSIEDDFVLAFSRLDRDRLRVALRKAKQRRAGLALAAGAQVELSDPAQIEPALHAVVEGVVGEPYAELRAVLGGAIDRLDARETKLVLALLKALGMDPAVPDGVAELRGLLQEISQRLDELETQIDRTIRTAARAKIAAGFRYEYDRISTRSSLLQATLTHDALRAHHAELIRGHADGLLEAIRAQQAGVELESYLQRRRLDTRKSWGFTLGFGAWSVYGRDRDRVTRVLDRNEQDRQRVAYTG
ncbi:MAG: alkaline phosphatase family protein, partial [Acidobacteriota bacterium]